MRDAIDNSYIIEGKVLLCRVKPLDEREIFRKRGKRVYYTPLQYDLAGIARDQANHYANSFKVFGFETRVDKDANLILDFGHTGILSFLAQRTNEHNDIAKRFKADRKRIEEMDEIEGLFYNSRVINYREIPRVRVSFDYFYFSESPRAEALRVLLGFNKV